MYIGCHLSISEGFYNSSLKAIELGANCFQVFTKNPLSLRPKKIDLEDAKKGKDFNFENNIKCIAHTPYITNLSTPKDALHNLTVQSILGDLKIAESFGALGAVVHCGKHVGKGVEYGITRMVQTLDEILKDFDGNTKLLLENTAGQGSELGTTIEELVLIRNYTRFKEKIGFCFDTCHGFAAGILSFDDEGFENFLTKIEKTGYLENLVAIHFNDSKVPFKSYKDRHQKIGKGNIGIEGLTKFLKHPVFKDLPFILETPVEDENEYAEEIKLLHNLRSK